MVGAAYRKTLLLQLLAVLATSAHAGDPTCVESIVSILGDYDWAGVGYPKYYTMLCTNPNALVSLYASAQKYCTPSDQEAGYNYYKPYCKEYGMVDMVPESEFTANLTPTAIAAIPVYSETDLNASVPLTAPFIPAEAWYKVSFRTEADWDFEERTHHHYSYAMYGFWGPVLIYGMLQNLIRHIVDKRRGYVYADAEGTRKATNGTPTLFKPGTRSLHRFGEYLADRTGIICYGNLPLVWMFAGRNNIFLWLTGWSFGTFNIFHKHIARVATIQAIIHSIGYTCFYKVNDNWDSYKASFKELWWTGGVVSTCFMSLIVFFSFSFFRSRTYEFFLLLHIVFSVLTLVFLWHHTAIFTLSEYNHPYLLPPIVIWGFDRLLRLVRQVYCNLYVSRNRGKGLLRTKTVATYHEESNMITIDMVPGNSHLFPGPGQHYYIYQPFRFWGWENHPFTMGYWARDEQSGELHVQFWIRPYDGWTKKLMRECKKKGGSTNTFSPTMFLEGPYGMAEPVHCFENVLLVAGGSGIAGVLPYLLDYVRRAEQTDKYAKTKEATGSNGEHYVPTRTRHVTLVWSDRSEKYIRQLSEAMLAPMLGRSDITISFHLTGSAVASSLPSHSTSTASSSTDDMHSPTSPGEKSLTDVEHEHEKGTLVVEDHHHQAIKKANARRINIQSGRPEVLPIVRKLADNIKGTQERLAVMVCGPVLLSDDVRNVVSQCMETNRDSIEYFEDSFGW